MGTSRTPQGSLFLTSGGVTMISQASAAWSELSDSISSRHQKETIKPANKPRYRAPYVEDEEEAQALSSRHQNQTIKPTPKSRYRASSVEDEEGVDNKETTPVSENYGIVPATAGIFDDRKIGESGVEDWRAYPLVFFYGRPVSLVIPPVREAYSRRSRLVNRLKHLYDIREAAALGVDPASPTSMVQDEEQLDAIIAGVKQAIHAEDKIIGDQYEAGGTSEETDTPSKEEEMETLRRRYNGSVRPPPSSTGATVGGWRRRVPKKKSGRRSFVTGHDTSSADDPDQTTTRSSVFPCSSGDHARPTHIPDPYDPVFYETPHTPPVFVYDGATANMDFKVKESRPILPSAPTSTKTNQKRVRFTPDTNTWSWGDD